MNVFSNDNFYVTQRCDEFTRNTTLCYRFLTRRVEESGREEEEESEERGKGGREETLVETRPPPYPVIKGPDPGPGRPSLRVGGPPKMSLPSNAPPPWPRRLSASQRRCHAQRHRLRRRWKDIVVRGFKDAKIPWRGRGSGSERRREGFQSSEMWAKLCAR